MIRIPNLRIPLDWTEEDLHTTAARKLRVSPSRILSVQIHRRSIDAREKQDIHFSMTLDVSVRNESAVLQKLPAGLSASPEPFEAIVPQVHPSFRPVVVGAGPSGLFAALILAMAGAKPVLIERGAPVEERIHDVEDMTRDGMLHPESNVQFGEGGAGTFSDGKLTTGTRNPWQAFVLQTFVDHGAPASILTDQKPHIGTDNLRHVVSRMRKTILSLGGSVRFHTKLTELITKDGQLRAVRLISEGTEVDLSTSAVFLCLGHSSRDTLSMLHALSLPMQQKPFAMGVRIEHLQSAINRAQYGSFADHPALGAASYKLNCTTPDGRGVYTFCMCPGGMVMAASSEPGRLCVNGMSEYTRDRVNSNSALLVGIPVTDFPSNHVLAGIALQQTLEEKAFLAGGGQYRAPAQRVEDFLASRPTKGFGEVIPSYLPGVTPSDLHAILPDFMSADLVYGIRQLDHQLHGFAHPDAVMTAMEARSSSPVRLLRQSNGQSEGFDGVFPCGEGAGYAGGIMSSAVDGILQALRFLEKEGS